jgi:O-antigen/teichoic acid export membrane protein
MTEKTNRAAPGLLRSAAVYGVSNILQRAIPVLLLPVLTFYLTAADVGMIAVFTAAVGIATPFVGVNVPYAVRRRYFDTDRPFQIYVANCLLILAIGTAAATMIVWLLRGPITLVSGLPSQWAVSAVLVAALQEFLMIPLTIWQVTHEPGRYAAVQVWRSVGLAGLTALFVVALGWGWEGAALAMIVTALGFGVAVAAPALRTWIAFRYEPADMRHAFRYGAGLIPHTLGTMGIRSIDRFVVAYYAGATENGLYWVGYQVGFVVSLVADAFNRAWTPWLYARLKNNDAATDRKVVRLTYIYFAGIAAFAVLLSLAAPVLMPLVLGPAFRDSGRFVSWIAVGFAFNGMYGAVAGFVFYAERTAILSWITGASAAASMALNFLLVPRYGAIGAAQAAAAALLMKFALTWIAAERVRPMPWRLAAARGSRAVSRIPVP